MKAIEQLSVIGMSNSNGFVCKIVANWTQIGSSTEATAEFDANSVKNAVITLKVMMMPCVDINDNLAN